MSGPVLIGLVGKAGAGKDTARAYLERQFGFTGLGFADPIRRMLAELLQAGDISLDYLTRRDLKEQPIPGLEVSYRTLAQTLGTEWGRSIQPDLWLRLAKSYVASVSSSTFGELAGFVVSDVRFVNEAAWFEEHPNAEIWRIVRPDLPGVREHVSESEQDAIKVTRTIHNDGTIEDLERKIKAIIDWRESV